MMQSPLFAPIRFLLKIVRWVLFALFGRFSWQPPPWLSWIGVGSKKIGGLPGGYFGFFLFLGLVGAGGFLGWKVYSQRPKPHTVSYSLEAPRQTRYEKSGPVISPVKISFSESVAPLKNIGEPVTAGISSEPGLEGQWKWQDDKTLQFTPKNDWSAGLSVIVHFDPKKLFAPGVLLKSYQTSFVTAPLSLKITDALIYQDPLDGAKKQLTATVKASHPLDEKSLRNQISLQLGEGLAFQDSSAVKWQLTMDKDQRQAHIQSALLKMPLETTKALITIEKGVRTSLGGSPTETPISQSISVPGRYQLTFSGITLSYVTTETGQPEQVLMFDSSFPVPDAAIRNRVHAWVLPKDKDWQLTADTLRALKEVSLTHIASSEPQNSHHSFKLSAPTGRRLYVTIDEQIAAEGGYLSKKMETATISTGAYPKIVRVLGEGAILSLKGEKKIGYMAQGVPGVRIEIAQILPNQLHHLVDQNYDHFARPTVYREELDRLVDRKEWTKTYPKADPAKPIFDHCDLSDYLDAHNNRKGIFVLRLSPFDPDNITSVDDEPDKEGDRRFILITDLGLIAKHNLDGSQDIYVQSIATGKPVDGAKIEVLGRNGLPVQDGRTDHGGHAHLTTPRDGLLKEKTPIMLTASLEKDLSFLPIEKEEHLLNMSRFDVGGDMNASEAGELSAYMFTDRRLYQPGETVHLGYILRAADWSRQLNGVPFEIDIVDPKGRTILKERKNLPADGLDSLDFTSSDNAPAGEYTATIFVIKNGKRADSLGYVNFRVRNFEPDRMKVHLHLADASFSGWAQPEDVLPKLTANHLFGAPASDRRVSASMRLTAALPTFKEYPGYRFHVAETLKETFEQELAAEKTSASGEAVLKPNLTRFGQATYQLSLTAKVYEAAGGHSVAAEDQILVSRSPYLVGVSAADSLDYISKGADRFSKWLAIGPDLQPRAIDKLHLVLVENQFVSVLVKQKNNTYKYESRKKEILRSDTPISLAMEGNELRLPTEEPGDFAYELRDAQGTVLNRLSWTVAGEANLSRSLERNAELQMKLDKTSYSPGETIQINLRAPYTGHGLITIERDKVYTHSWFTADTTSSVQTITVPKELEGNGYVNVQFVRDINSPEVFMSPLSYGAASFKVALDNHTLPVTMKTPTKVQPGESVRMEVKTDQPARAILFAIDEGILQVARYTSPDPLGFFFRKRALDVDTSQILSLILPEFNRLLKASAPGGGDDEEAPSLLNPFKRKKREPVAYWSGIIDIPAEGYTFTYTAPDSFNGRLRIMAVVVTGSKMGVAEGSCEVRGPWVLTPNLPSFAAPGDEIVITTGLFSNLAAKEEAIVTLKTGAGVSILNAAEQKVIVEPQKEQTLEFRVKAAEILGSTDLTFSARSAGGQAEVKEALSVRPLSPFRTALRSGLLTKESLTLQPERTLHDAYRNESISYDSTPLVWVRGLSAYLEKYPHGCTEQVLSQAMPNLILTPSEEMKKDGGKPLNRALSILRERQSESGGFSTWANNLTVDDEISVYAADFLHEVRLRGLAVPQDLEAHSRKYLNSLVQKPAENLSELRTRARAIYLLTRQGIVTSGAIAATIEQLEAHHKTLWKKDLTAAYLAASHILLKQERKGKNLISEASWQSLPRQENSSQEQKTAPEESFSYYDDLATDAELLTILARHFPDQLAKVPENLLGQFAERLSTDRFNSLSAALLIRSLELYGKSSTADSQALKAIQEPAAGEKSPLALTGFPKMSILAKDWKSLVLTRDTSSLPAFFQLTEAGYDVKPPETELRQGLEIQREYLNADNTPVSQVKVGDEFTVRLRFRATNHQQEIHDIAVVDLLPAGLEPVFIEKKEAVASEDTESETDMDNEEEEDTEAETDMDNEEEEDTEADAGQQQKQAQPADATDENGKWTPEFVDTRDDRVIVYGTVFEDAIEYTYRVRAINAGLVKTPPPYAEGMYDRSLQARGTSGQLTITAP